MTRNQKTCSFQGVDLQASNRRSMMIRNRRASPGAGFRPICLELGFVRPPKPYVSKIWEPQ